MQARETNSIYVNKPKKNQFSHTICHDSYLNYRGELNMSLAMAIAIDVSVKKYSCCMQFRKKKIEDIYKDFIQHVQCHVGAWPGSQAHNLTSPVELPIATP